MKILITSVLFFVSAISIASGCTAPEGVVKIKLNNLTDNAKKVWFAKYDSGDVICDPKGFESDYPKIDITPSSNPGSFDYKACQESQAMSTTRAYISVTESDGSWVTPCYIDMQATANYGQWSVFSCGGDKITDENRLLIIGNIHVYEDSKYDCQFAGYEYSKSWATGSDSKMTFDTTQLIVTDKIGCQLTNSTDPQNYTCPSLSE